ncbi:acyl-CoA dehydrogenase [Nocardia nova]|uniref:Acyl-CoA dehydrogenase n=1 Tax=Nocardia nova TaxID=37330 RepID=A0A2S6AQ68_9NOCA|nr:acyl-CoA dehydrogenase family protein [Nocardia nova]PPJ26585.1 acyl-CoA dehydrogenase [Nocardia nova]PPJ37385.1 acyl-CoA dehydrogenase [Nocardia nova]
MYGVRSAEQEELSAVVRKLLEERSSEAAVRATMDSAEGYDRDLAALMAEQMGLHGIAIPEEYGGAGFGFVELSVVLEEMGRVLLCGPFFSSVVLFATALLEAGDDDACRTWLPRIAAGRLVGTVAFVEEAEGLDEQSIRLAARRNNERYLLSGRKYHVLDGGSAEAIVVAARLPEGVGLFVVDTDLGVRRTVAPTLDRTRRQATLDFEDTPARLLAGPGHGWAILRRVLDRAAVALACEQAGGAERVLEMAVDYAKTRHQFDRPIGSFQAIKHKCADMLVAVESARSAARCAADAVAANDPDLELLAGLAKTVCSDAFSLCARDNIQIHGGIGFTWEHPAHLYYKRAKSSEAHFGTPRHHRERLALRAEALPA